MVVLIHQHLTNSTKTPVICVCEVKDATNSMDIKLLLLLLNQVTLLV